MKFRLTILNGLVICMYGQKSKINLFPATTLCFISVFLIIQTSERKKVGPWDTKKPPLPLYIHDLDDTMEETEAETLTLEQK